MNGQDRFETDLRGWLHDQAPRSAPEGLVPTGMSAVRGIPQRRTLAWFFATPPVVRVLAAGVVVAGVLAAALLLDVLPSTAPGVSPSPLASPAYTLTCGLADGCDELIPVVQGAVAYLHAPVESITVDDGTYCLVDPYDPIICSIIAPPQGATYIARARVRFSGLTQEAFLNLYRFADAKDRLTGAIGYHINVLERPALQAATVTCGAPRCQDILDVITPAVADVAKPIRAIDITTGSFCLGDPFHAIPCAPPLKSDASPIGSAEVRFWLSPLHAFFNLYVDAHGAIVYDRNDLPEPGSTEPPASPSASEPVGQPGFTTNAPPAADATWTSITWTRLAQDDVRTKVARVVRWSGGYIALGQEVLDSGLNMRTPAWISADGVTWAPLRPSVFGFSTVIVGVVEVPGGLVAITATSPSCLTSPCPSIRGVLASWTSTDGRSWTRHPGPGLIADGVDEQPPVVASGPGGIVVATGQIFSRTGGVQQETEGAISRDGMTWTPIPTSAFPDGFVLGGLWGRADGYAAVGAIGPDIENTTGLALWSSDGETWAPAEGALVAVRGGNALVVTGPPGWSVGSIDSGSDGAIAIGGIAAAPGMTLWWQSSDGRHWHKLENYPPIGAWPGPGEGMNGIPDGWMTSDGNRLAALRLRADPTAWVSFDGASWTSVPMKGDVPRNPENTGVLTVLPGGLLYTDNGGNWWYGAASAP